MFLKKLFLTVATVVMATQVSSAHADTCNPCDPCPSFCEDLDLCHGWTANIDWIYWRTRRCDLDYAIPFVDGDQDSIGSVHDIEPSYDNGFRIGLKKAFCDMDVGFHYTYYRTDEKDKATSSSGYLAGTHLRPLDSNQTQGEIGLADAEWSLDYDVFDLEMGYNTQFNGCLDTRFFGGAKFAFIDQDFDIIYSGVEDVGLDKIYHDLNMDAYGLSIGVDNKYSLFRCINFIGSFSYDALVAKFTRNLKYITASSSGSSSTTYVDLDDECWKLVSVLNLAVGLEYNFKTPCCLDGSLSLGYEFHHWFNTSGFLIHHNYDAELITLDRHSDSLGFDGLFLRFGLSF